MEAQAENRKTRKRNYHLVAVRLNREDWKEFVALQKKQGSSGTAALRGHIAAALATHEADKGSGAIADDLESFITSGGTDAE